MAAVAARPDPGVLNPGVLKSPYDPATDPTTAPPLPLTHELRALGLRDGVHAPGDRIVQRPQRGDVEEQVHFGCC